MAFVKTFPPAEAIDTANWLRGKRDKSFKEYAESAHTLQGYAEYVAIPEGFRPAIPPAGAPPAWQPSTAMPSSEEAACALEAAVNLPAGAQAVWMPPPWLITLLIQIAQEILDQVRRSGGDK